MFVGICLQGKADTNKTTLTLDEGAMLSDITIRQIKPLSKQQKLFDGVTACSCW